MRRELLGKPHKFGYRFSTGFYLLKNKRTQKFFWLGHDKQGAEDKVINIQRLYERDAATDPTSGKKIWSDDGLAQALATAKAETAPVVFAVAPVVAQTILPSPATAALPAPADGLTLYGAIELYKGKLKNLLLEKTLGEKHYEALLHRFQQMKNPKALARPIRG